jgi:lipoprotein-anchoring transpeptidase ErfK/SrfK
MNSPVLKTVRALLVAAALVACLVAVPAFAVTSPDATRGPVPNNATVAGFSLQGLTPAAARALISSSTTLPATPPLLVIAGTKQFTYDPRTGAMVDVDSMMNLAYEPTATASFEIPTLYSARTGTINGWISKMSKAVDKKAVNALYARRGAGIRVVKAKKGSAIDRTDARAQLRTAVLASLASSQTSDPIVVTLKLKTVKPKTEVRNLGTALLVDLSQRKITLFKGGKIVKKYGCAVGMPAYPTPTGNFKIVLKRYRPTWRNPGSAWARNMPAYIAPGPRNPLGTRAMNLNVSGIRIHGTYKYWSIGHAASHGCMRMRQHDVEDLYGRVRVGTPVYIVK